MEHAWHTVTCNGLRFRCRVDGAQGLPWIRANDGALPATMRSMQATIPGSRFEEIPGAGHLPNLEQPERFNAILASFLEQAW